MYKEDFEIKASIKTETNNHIKDFEKNKLMSNLSRNYINELKTN